MRLTRRNLMTAAAGLAALPHLPKARAQSAVTLNVLYSGAYVNKEPMEAITRQFEAANSDIRIKLDVVKGYAEMTQLMLRSAITGSLPDVGFQGLSFVRLFAERELAVPLDPFIAAEPGWEALGYSKAVMSLAEMKGKTYGVPFEISVPIVYVNADLVRQAGGDPDKLPRSWPEIIELARRIKAESGGIYFDYTPTGNWTFMALVSSMGGAMMTPDDRQIAFDGPAGTKAMGILHDIGAAGMKDMTRDQAKQAFVGGSIGMLVTSSSDITLYTTQVNGRFDLRVVPFPVDEPGGSLPAGGNAIMIHSKDKAKQDAAWKFVKFATGPEAQTVMATMTSYIPVNSLAIADPKLLGDYYRARPNLAAAVDQLPLVSKWFSFPGENSMKITTVIEDRLRAVILQQQGPDEGLSAMTAEVKAMLPQS